MSTHPWRPGMRHPNFHVAREDRAEHRRTYQRRWAQKKRLEAAARLVFAGICSRGHDITGGRLVWGQFDATCATCWAETVMPERAAIGGRAA